MPVCKKCKNTFPNRVIIDNKERMLCSRKYCLVCSPFNYHNTRKLEPHIPHKYNTKSRMQCVCGTCERKYLWDRNNKKGHTQSTCNTCLNHKRRMGLKEKCVNYKGGKCGKCGYDKCHRALEFHHIDPSIKDSSISGSYCRSWDWHKNELDKCVLLCCRCHRELEDHVWVLSEIVEIDPVSPVASND